MSQAAKPLLEVSHLRVELPVGKELRPVVSDVTLRVNGGEALGVVGESGSGKSMTAKAIARILPPGAKCSGTLSYAGEDVLAMDRRALKKYYTESIGMIFQDPRVHINPVRTIGDFMTEAMVSCQGVKAAEARRRAVQLLDEVGVPAAERRLAQYPHELSGGLLQRVMIAAALIPGPRLLIADEPTTALDVTTQAEVVAILNEQRKERGLAVFFITHNLDLAAAICDRTAVMYAGTIVEEQSSARLHEAPQHPYSAALLHSRPDIERPERRLSTIAGTPVAGFEAPAGCPFAPRCPFTEPACRDERPALRPAGDGVAACIRVGRDLPVATIDAEDS